MGVISDYEKITEIPLNSKVTFQEFTINSHQKVVKSVEVTGRLQRIIKSNESLNREELEQYYPGLERTEDFVALSVYFFYRLVLIVGVDNFNLPIYKTIHINKYFLHTKLQKLQYENAEQQVQVVPQDMLGFDRYQIGQKFKS